MDCLGEGLKILINSLSCFQGRDSGRSEELVIVIIYWDL